MQQARPTPYHIITVLLARGTHLLPDSMRIQAAKGQRCEFCGDPSSYTVKHDPPYAVCALCMQTYSSAKREYLLHNVREICNNCHVSISRVALLRHLADGESVLWETQKEPCNWCRFDTPYHDTCRDEYIWLLSVVCHGTAKWLLFDAMMLGDITQHIRKLFVVNIHLSGVDYILQGGQVPSLPISTDCELPSALQWLPNPRIHLEVMKWVKTTRKTLVLHSLEKGKYYSIRDRDSRKTVLTAGEYPGSGGRYLKLALKDRFKIPITLYLSEDVDILFTGYYDVWAPVCLACGTLVDLLGGQHAACKYARTLWHTGRTHEAISFLLGGELFA